MKILRKTMTVMAVGAAVLAPLAIAGEGNGEAAKQKNIAKRACKVERAENGRDAFREAYGKNAMRNCKRAARGEIRNAAHECKAERDELGREAFDEQYGTNRNKRNSFGKCVSSKVRDAVDPVPDDEDTGETDTEETGTDTGGDGSV